MSKSHLAQSTEDECGEEKAEKCGVRLLVKHCYEFMTKNIEHHIPTYSHLKAKNIKINQGQNFKPFERCEFKGLCHPSIQIFKAPLEEPISSNTKLARKSDASTVQVQKRNVKTTKVSNIIFQPNEASDSVKTYIDIYKNKRPGIRTKRIVEEAVIAYNATRDEQAAKRNILRSKAYFKKESISDTDLINKQTCEQETFSRSDKQRRTVKVKNGQLPTKSFLERMKEYNSSKKIREEANSINLNHENLNIPLATYHEKLRRNTNVLPALSLPRLKIRPLNRKEKNQCPMSIINITFPKEDDDRNELNNQCRQKQDYSKYYGDIQKQRGEKCNKLWFSQDETNSECDMCNCENGQMNIPFIFPCRENNVKQREKKYFNLVPNHRKNDKKYYKQIETERWVYPSKKTRPTYEKEQQDINNYNAPQEKMHLIKSFKQFKKAWKMIDSAITDSCNNRELKSLNETLQNVQDLMKSNRVILDSLKTTQTSDRQLINTQLKNMKEKYPLAENFMLPNKPRLPGSTSEDSFNLKNNYYSKKDKTNCNGNNITRNCLMTQSSDDCLGQAMDMWEKAGNRLSPKSSEECLNGKIRFFLDNSEFPKSFATKKPKNTNYQSFWKNPLC